MEIPTWQSGAVALWAHCVVADNPSEMTLHGTNTWIIHTPGTSQAVVVDPGPLDRSHLSRILEVVRHRGARVGLIVITHHHLDHTEGARELSRRCGDMGPQSAPHYVQVRALDPQQCLHGGDALSAGEVIADPATKTGPQCGVRLEAITTPGHTADSISLIATGPDNSTVIVCGDTILGFGTTVIAHPDGNLGDYLATLDSLENHVAQRGVSEFWPGHGPVLADPRGVLDKYRHHRLERLEQVRQAIAQGARSPIDVVRSVYANVPQNLWPAAEMSVRAQWDYLSERDG